MGLSQTMPPAQHEILRALRQSSLLGENHPHCVAPVVVNSRSRRTNAAFRSTEQHYTAPPLFLSDAHNIQVEKYAAPHKRILPPVATLAGDIAIGEARLKNKRHVDESFFVFGLILLILLGCGAMHLSIYNPQNFWPAGACVLISGLALEFLSERQFEHSRRIVHSKIQTQPTFKQCRRRSSIRRDSFIYCQNRSIALP
eukprot:2773302-Rhodomonas_salina.1